MDREKRTIATIPCARTGWKRGRLVHDAGAAAGRRAEGSLPGHGMIPAGSGKKEARLSPGCLEIRAIKQTHDDAMGQT
jgi:hypothetical protein